MKNDFVCLCLNIFINDEINVVIFEESLFVGDTEEDKAILDIVLIVFNTILPH